MALPLEAINAACSYEKMPGIGPHPRGLHLWWARRPLAAARAVIWASLVDDPSSLPEQFPTAEKQSFERERLFKILSDLVKWENSNNQEVLNAAKYEIMKSTGGNPPPLLDPFAGGGAIPLEAQRLGLETHAGDLNPVAVLINKAMIEIPPKFANHPPVNPESGHQLSQPWSGIMGLAEDVRYYGKWMKEKAFERIGHLYPKIKDEQGQQHTVISWIWARTVKCPNPACGCEMPLVSSFELSRKKGREAHIQPIIEGTNIRYEVKHGKNAPKSPKISRGKFLCICCSEPVQANYIKAEGKSGRIGAVMTAIVAERKGGRFYTSSNRVHENAADCTLPAWMPEGDIPSRLTGGTCVPYGYDEWYKIFTNRQLTALTELSDLLDEVQSRVESDGGAVDYAHAIKVYLAFAVDRTADFSTSNSRWAVSNEKAMNLFSKQAIPMTWDYPEVNIFANSVGGFETIVEFISKCMMTLPLGDKGLAKQQDAQTDVGIRNIMVSTDPPYYDNISYGDLSDFFYVWLRHNLRSTFPDLFRTMFVPKTEELIAAPYRFDGSQEKARDFFEDGMLQAFKQINMYVTSEIPVTVYYAFKQSEYVDNSTISTGWETMLSAIIQAGFTITGTWPMRSEQAYRAISINTNALASSIVLVCRKRLSNAAICTRRDFTNALKRELKPALEKLQASNIAPVDLAQSAIGPCMSVYSRFSQVLEADGTQMSVRSALQIINQELDMYFSEHDGELDRDSCFCIELYSQYAFNNMQFGEADVLARAKNTSVERLAGRGVLYAQKGVVRLLTREEISTNIEKVTESTWLLAQQLTRAMETGGGVQEAAEIVSELFGSVGERAKALAYRLFTLSERKGWAHEAFAYNSLVIAWPEIQAAATDIQSRVADSEQMSLLDAED